MSVRATCVVAVREAADVAVNVAVDEDDDEDEVRRDG
jgi:hypothetical protein